MALISIKYDGLGECQAKAITSKLSQLKEILMGMKEDYAAGFAKIDAATTAIADRIQRYIDKVKAGGMTAAEEAAALAELGRVTGPLEAMGADPVDPVPVPVPPEEPAPVEPQV